VLTLVGTGAAEEVRLVVGIGADVEVVVGVGDGRVEELLGAGAGAEEEEPGGGATPPQVPKPRRHPVPQKSTELPQ